jgi:ribosomal protein L37AE/L43A
MTPPCMRCNALTTTTPYGAGLWLCGHCEVRPVCGEFQHTYRARDGLGCWICLLCGHTLTSQKLSTAIVQADQAPAMDWYC